MDNRTKNAIYSLIVVAAVVIVYFIRKDSDPNATPPLVQFQGKTMGPIVYNIKYFDEQERNLKLEVDSVLEVFNQSLNTYIPQSEISQFNRDSVFQFDLPYFREALITTKEISKATDGAFNPTLGPLINLWGFGYENVERPDSTQIDSLKQLVDYDLIQYNEEQVWKLNENVALDFSASAKGQGVDVVAEYLEGKGITNYFVEIGGEVRTGGKNLEREQGWVVGILHPESEESNLFFYATLELPDKGMATSGNYFNYRVVDGIRYSHTIDPVKGYPIELPILSATVIAEDCQTADALATAFMVMGHEEAIEFLNNNSTYGALLIYNDEEGQIKHYATEGLSVSIQ